MRTPMRSITAASTVAGLLAVGCGGSSSDPSTQASSSKDSSKPIVIGAAIAKTGVLQPYDGPSFAAFSMAIDDANAQGGVNGRKIKILSADTKSEIPNGATVAKSLLGRGADMLAVSCDFDFGSPAAQVAQSASKISMSLCAQSPKFQSVGDKAYTVSASVLSEGVVVATFARKKRNLNNAFLLVDDSLQYNTGLCDGFTKGFTEQGGAIAGEVHFKSADDLAADLTKVKGSKADAVILCSIPPNGSSALRQLRAAGINLPLLSGGGMDGTYWGKAVPNLSNFYITTQASVFGNDSNAAVNDFVKKFTEKTGAAPATAYAVVGYSAGQALVAALKASGGDPSGDAVKSKLDAFKNQPLLVGPTTFSSAIHIPVSRPMVVLEYRNGKPSYVTNQAPGVEIGLTA
jgi:branched-chain amino acid transport system substrate-binding protein